MRTHTAHSYRGMVLFLGLFTLALFFSGLLPRNAEAGSASFGFRYDCFPGDPCPKATSVGAWIRTDKDVYSPGETINLYITVASDDAPQGNGDVRVRYGINTQTSAVTIDYSPSEFPGADERYFASLTAPATPGAFNVALSVGLNSYAPTTGTQYIPLTVSAPAVPPSTANLTVNGVSNVTVTEGQTLNYNWSSTNGSSYSSTYSTSPACGGSGAWSGRGNSANGSQSDVADIPDGQTQCVYVITYNVTGSGGNSSDSITVTINATPAVPACSYTTYWGSCSVSCGGGTRYQYYNNVTGSCSAGIGNGLATGVEETCNPQVCPPATYPLTVTTAGAGAGTVTANLGGINCPGDCTQDYSAGAVVTLTATPAGGSSFAGWSGACSGAASTCQVTMSIARGVTAMFTIGAPVPPPTASLTIDGYAVQNVTLPPNTPHTKRWTSTNGSTYSSTYLWSGASCPISGQSGAWVANDAGNTAGNTTDPVNLGCTASITYTVTNSAGVSAQSTLNLTVACPAGQFWDGDSCEVTPGPTPQCSDGVDNGDPEDSIADYPADPGCFDANDDDETDSLPPGCATPPCGGGGGSNPLFVTIDGAGKATSNPVGINCTSGTCSAGYSDGTVVTLTATPDASETFTGWSGDCSGAGSCTVTMNGRRDVTATFSGGTPECSNGVDDDADGAIDSPGDLECGDPTDNSESSLGGTPMLNASPRQLPIGGGASSLWWNANGGGACTLAGVFAGKYEKIYVDAVVEEANPFTVTGITASTEYKLECSGGATSLWIFVDGKQHET